MSQFRFGETVAQVGHFAVVVAVAVEAAVAGVVAVAVAVVAIVVAAELRHSELD